MKFAIAAACVLGFAAVAGLSGCASSGSQNGTQAGASMGFVNARCPMRPDCTNPLSTSTDYKSQNVGFCCAGCVGQWNKLTDEQRDERLARVRK